MAIITITKELVEELAAKADDRDYKVMIHGHPVAFVRPLFYGCVIVECGGPQHTFEHGDSVSISVFKREPGW